MSSLVAPVRGRDEPHGDLPPDCRAEALTAFPINAEDERQTALRLLSDPFKGSPIVASALPALATASDIREAVQFLKKRPAGVTIVEAMDDVKKRAFDPRKVTAYEFWGIVAREGDRLKLSPLGWEFARKLEPETHVYRRVLNNTIPYRAVLEWMDYQSLELVTHTDVAAYWQEHHREAIDRNSEKNLEGNVVSFFHLCQAAELGTVTIGKRGQPARLRLDREELHNYLEAKTPSSADEPTAEEVFERNEMPAAAAPTVEPQRREQSAPVGDPQKLCVFISLVGNTKLVKQIQETLELTDIESRLITARTESETALVEDRVLQAMRECNAGLFVVTREECRANGTGSPVLNETLLIEMGAAFVLYDRRVVLLWDKQIPLPANLQGVRRYEFEGDALSWDTGMQLMKTVKDFKQCFQQNGCRVS